MKRQPEKKIISKIGFTLIELIVVFSVMAILSTAGLAAFVSYSRQQTINTVTQEIKTMLFDARSRASSQVSLCATGQSFDGYLVIFCPKNDTCAPCSLGPTPGYQLEKRCGGVDTIAGIEKPLPPNVTVVPDSHNILFGPVSGTVSPQCDGLAANHWNIAVSGYGKTQQTITVNDTGIIK